MRLTLLMLVSVSFFISGCNATPNDVSAIGLSTATPFQPGQGNASDSLYVHAAPTPQSLPTVTLPTIPPRATPTEIIHPTPTVPPVLNPLTGLPQADPALLERRPMAIKIANYPRYIRPQSGLTLADQVFEYYIEGGLTRNIAIFYGSDSEWVGPVRSGRFFDENIARMYQSYLVFKFADPRVLDYFRTTDIADFLVVPGFGECPPFKLLPERKIEVYNNSYFNTILWNECVMKDDLPNDRPYIGGLFSQSLPSLTGIAGTNVYTYFSDYSYSHWQYDPGTMQYLRFQETDDIHNGREEKYEPLFDRMTGQQVHASNVVVLFTYHTFANPFDEDDEVYHIDLTGTGEAYVFRDGVGITAQWNRVAPNQPLFLTTPYGDQIPLHPGITYYEVIGSNSYASQGDGEWFFHHTTP